MVHTALPKILSCRSSNQKVQTNKEEQKFDELWWNTHQSIPDIFTNSKNFVYPPAHMYLHRMLFWNDREDTIYYYRRRY